MYTLFCIHLQTSPRSYPSCVCIIDDPLWWKDDEVKLLAGTRLQIAVKEHLKLLSRLTGWKNRLVELQRYSVSDLKYINP